LREVSIYANAPRHYRCADGTGATVRLVKIGMAAIAYRRLSRHPMRRGIE